MRYPLAPLFLAFVVLSSGCIVIPIGDLLRGPELTEQVLVEGAGFFSQEKIAIVDVDGVISGEESSSLLLPRENSVAEIKAKLSLLRRDPEVKAVVLRISSPGGEVTACDVIHHELQRFKKQTGIPVVASIGDQGASGGYYIAMAADVILASPTGIVGSIGVLLQHLDVSGLLGKVGVSFSPIKSADKKDLNSPFRPMTNDERAVLQRLVDDMYNRFLDVIVEGRPGLTRDEILKLADGRVVSGVEAVKLKLVDQTGYLADAIDEAVRRAGIESPTIVRYTRILKRGANIYSESETPNPGATEFQLGLKVPWVGSGPKLLYLWQPDL